MNELDHDAAGDSPPLASASEVCDSLAVTGGCEGSWRRPTGGDVVGPLLVGEDANSGQAVGEMVVGVAGDGALRKAGELFARPGSGVVPVAEEYKIRLALHPEDPGTPPGYRGVDRVLGTVDGLKKFVAMHESPYHGLNFCQGTISEIW